MFLRHRRAYPWILLLVSCIMVAAFAVVWSRLWLLASIEIPEDYGLVSVADLGLVSNWTEAANSPNEDRSIALKLEDGSFFTGVFDGHGGADVSELASRLFTLEAVSFEDANAAWSSAEATLTSIFASVQNKVAKEQWRKHVANGISYNGKDLRIGSCALIAWTKKNKLFLANLGDSSAYFFSDDGQLISRLNHMHNIALASEQEALMRRFPDIPEHELFRCRDSPSKQVCYLRGRLQVTRALGDQYLEPFLTHDPEVGHFEFDRPGHIVVATDGYWDEFPFDEDIATVGAKLQSLRQSTMTMSQKADALVQHSYEAAGRRTKMSPHLLEYDIAPGSYKRRIIDDITVVLIRVEAQQPTDSAAQQPPY